MTRNTLEDGLSGDVRPPQPRIGLDLDLHFRLEKPRNDDDRRRGTDRAENFALNLQHRLAISDVGDEGADRTMSASPPPASFIAAAMVA